jgi:hypothetical protein
MEKAPSDLKNEADQRERLISECKIITHYLVGRWPEEDLVLRYVEANQILLAGRADPIDESILAFIRRRPRSLPYLDAALALLRRQAILRDKILLMLAILEATPQFTSAFLPEPLSKIGFLARMTGYGITSGIRFFIGTFLYPFAIKAKA